MQTKVTLSFFTLLLLISFASVNAVLFTPALPDIAIYFKVSEGTAQQTITWFLIGYAVGQLLYGPLANRFGRKPALYMGIGLQVISSLLCVLAGVIHQYEVLILGRLMLALGSGVGLKMTFTLINECYAPQIASQKIAYLMLAFAVTPALGVALGGFLNFYYGWMSCFYAGAVYGLILLGMVSRMPETLVERDLNAFKMDHLIHGYGSQFKNKMLMLGGVLMGCATCFIYVFAALAPFIAMTHFTMSSAQYGLANMIPPIGLIAGSLVSARLSKRYSARVIIQWGVGIASIGSVLMGVAILLKLPVLFALFFPIIIVYFGLCFVLANASSLAMSYAKDKSHGSAVMNFINMGFTTVVVLSIGAFSTATDVLPAVYLMLCVLMMGVVWRLDVGS
ncbi:MAG: MFS transporter [Gammaproteobacteria bacterium]|nr:MFS transporter [Gammaproteobacteria bacterium]